MAEQIVNESSADGDTVIDVIDVRKSYQVGGMEIPILNWKGSIHRTVFHLTNKGSIHRTVF
jgi:hypothetical protein